MALIGIIEKKKGKTATILVNKILPCGDKCRNCSAGCKLYSIHIQKEVNEGINVGDCLRVLQKDEAALNSSKVQVAIPAIMLTVSIILAQLFPKVENRGAATALAVLVSIIASHFAIKFYDKMQMKKNADHFILGEKCDPQNAHKL